LQSYANVSSGLIDEEEQKVLKAISLPNRTSDLNIRSTAFQNKSLADVYNHPKSTTKESDSVRIFSLLLFCLFNNWENQKLAALEAYVYFATVSIFCLFFNWNDWFYRYHCL